MAAIMVQSWAEIPTFDCMGCPCFANGGLNVNEDASARGSEWSAIVIEGTVELSVGR
jgi:hypothetical protein